MTGSWIRRLVGRSVAETSAVGSPASTGSTVQETWRLSTVKCRQLIAPMATLSILLAGCGGGSSSEEAAESLPASAEDAGGLDALI